MSESARLFDEAKAIAELRKLAKQWPKSLLLASMDGELVVFRSDDRFDVDGESLDPEKVLVEIPGIPNTGGSW